MKSAYFFLRPYTIHIKCRLLHSVGLLTVLLHAALFLTVFLTPAFAGHEEDSWLFNRQGMAKVSQGETEGAIRDFEKACQLNPFNDTALANLACARNNLGVALAQKKNFKEAIRQFTAAKAQKPEDISIRLNLLSTLVTLKNAAAVEQEAREIVNLRPTDVDLLMKVSAAFQKTENPAAAVAVLQELADRVPDNAKVQAMLGRLLYRSGDLTESEFHLNRSIEIDPADAGAKKFLSRIEREASVEKNSTTFTSVHFSLSCPDSFSEEWAEKLLGQLEEACEEVGSRLNFYPSQRSQVLVMQTEDFRRVHDLPDWAGGLYDGKIRLPVPGTNLRPSALRGAVMHEYTHHVVFLLSSGNCPIWLNEGLAQMFENGADKLDSYLFQSKNSQITSLANVDAGFKNAPDRQQAAMLYRLALGASARLAVDYGWQRITEFLSGLALGYSGNRASNEAFAIDFNELEILCLNTQNDLEQAN